MNQDYVKIYTANTSLIRRNTLLCIAQYQYNTYLCIEQRDAPAGRLLT